jgi:hypothetical protein
LQLLNKNLFKFKTIKMIKRLLLLTAIFGFAVSCNDYEDDFANLNDQLNGVDAKLDNIQSTVDGIADIQLELLNINDALAAIATSIGELPTVDDINNLSLLITETSNSLSDKITDLDGDLQAVATSIVAQLDAMEDMIENGFSAVNTSFDLLNTNIEIIDGKIEILQTSVDENGTKIDANGNAIIDLAGAVAVVDGKIVAVDGKLDDVLSNLTGQLADMLNNITAQFATVNTNAESNAQDALLWYQNTLNELGDVEVDILAAVNNGNQAIINQLASMLTSINSNFSAQASQLTDMELEILLQVGNAQTAIGTNLTQINTLTGIVNQLSADVTNNDTEVDNQLAAIKALIDNLQLDVTTLLDNITTVYNGDLSITNDAELTYALTLKEKVAVINGYVNIDSEFATGAQVDSLQSVMNKFNTVTGKVDIDNAILGLTADNLRSIGGNYSVSSNPVSTPDLEIVANNVTLHYNNGTDYVTYFTNIGGVLEIRDNGASVVDFSNLDSVGSFNIISPNPAPFIVTNTLTNPTFVNLGNISNADISTFSIYISYSASQTADVKLISDTNLNVNSGPVPVYNFAGFEVEGSEVYVSVDNITGNLSVTAQEFLSFNANNIGAAGADVTVDITSNGQSIYVGDVFASTFGLNDTGSGNLYNTFFSYNTMTATTFNYNSSTQNPAAPNGANKFNGNDWTVGTTSLISVRNIRFTNFECNSNLDGTAVFDGVVDGNFSVTTSGQGAGVIMDIGKMVGDLTIDSAQNVTVKSYVANAADVNITGEIDIESGKHANGGGNNILGVYVTDCNAAAANTGTIVGDVSFINSSTTAGDVSMYFKEVDGNVTAGSTKSIVFGSAAGPEITGDFTITSSGSAPAVPTVSAANGVRFNANTDVGGTISVDIDGLFDGANFNATSTRTGDMSIDAGLGITLPTFTSLGASLDAAAAATTYTTTLTSDGDIVASAVTAIAHDATITTTAGDINLSSLTSAVGVIDVQSSTGNVDTRLLSTHDGSSLTVGGTLIMVESLVSSTGDLTLNGDLVQADLTADEASPLLATWNTLTVGSDTLVELPAHVDSTAGAMTLTLAQAVSTNSITIAEVSAPAMTSLELTAQSTSFALVAGDFDNAAVNYTINITGDASLDAMSFVGVSNLTGLTTAGNVDTFVVAENANLATISAGHVNVTGPAANPLGTKLHLIDNTSLTAYTSNTSKMHEIIITGNTALANLDLTSYLSTTIDLDSDGIGDATNEDTAFDGNTVNFTFNVFNNGLTGSFTPKDNSGTPNTSLLSDDLVDSGVKNIALHLLNFTQGTVDVLADFDGLISDPNAVDTYNADTDFTDGINSIPEFTLLANETP